MRAALIGFGLLACSTRAPRPFTLDDAIPAVASPYACGPLERGENWVRRKCLRGKVSISVTVARQPATDSEYARWVQMSAAYPSAQLPLPAERATGFYDCVQDRCDLHVQLRSGYHLELFSSGTATRTDLDALVRALPLAALDAQ